MPKKASMNSRIKLKLDNEIRLGNLDAKRDWGHAKDYVRAMWLMLQQNEPEDYVIATGISHSVGEFLEEACKCVGIDHREYLAIDENLYRPAEVNILQGDASKAKAKLNWNPSISFKDLVQEMVDADLRWYAAA